MVNRISFSVFFIFLLNAICLNSQSLALTHSVSPFTDTTIQDMIDAAEEGDTVLVASGTYIGEGNRDISFNGKDIVLLSEQGPEHTVIDCEDLGRGLYLTSGLSSDAVISGFTIQNGGSVAKGGCIYIDSSSPSIKNCFIFSGGCGTGGAGIHLEYSSSTIDNCSISQCYSFGGGAVCTAYSSNVFTNCMIQNNESGYQGAGLTICNTTTTISDCIITDNIVDSWDGDARGGGIYSYESDIIVERCEISNNTCEGGWIAFIDGGGISCEYGSVIISDCLIFGNSADNGGGGGLQLFIRDMVITILPF